MSSTRGRKPVQLQFDYPTWELEVKLLEEFPCPETPRQIPYHWLGNCGPDGSRTRTLKLDRLTCCQLHHGPIGPDYVSERTPASFSRQIFRTGLPIRERLTVFNRTLALKDTWAKVEKKQGGKD